MSSKGYHWYNNGEIQINAKECPDGFIAGMLLESSQKSRETSFKNDVYVNRVYTEERNKKISETKNRAFEELKKRITYDILYKWYIEGDNDYKDGPTYFGITQWSFDRLCKEYGIKKDRSKARGKGIETNIEKYGSIEEYYKHVSDATKTTRKIKYGSLINYSQQMSQKIKNSWGIKTEEDKENILVKTRETNNEKYGVDYTCQRPEAKVSNNNSKPNESFANLLDMANISYIREFPIDTYVYDFKINNFLIEIDPTYTHNINIGIYNNLPRDKTYHLTKTKLAKENGYRCIHVFDWDDSYKIINLLTPRIKIYAKECEIKEVDKKEAIEYLNKHHLQGYAKDKIRLGLYYKDELVSIMTFDKPRYNKNYEWELIRFCSHYLVVGGEQKLFNHFIKNYNPQSIISYCDNAKFEGKAYNKLGFSLVSEGIPTIHYYNIKTKVHITDNLLRQQGFDRLFNANYGKGTNNEELMLENGFLQVYDCGQSKYVYTRK